MNAISPPVYRFGSFTLDAQGWALYHRDVLVEDGGKKTFQVLEVMLRNANKLVSHQEIIDGVWGEDAFGVRPDHINHYVSKLRGILTSCETGAVTIESVKGRGYIIHADVATDHEPPKEDFAVFSVTPARRNTENDERLDGVRDSRVRLAKVLAVVVIGAALLIVTSAFGYWRWFRQHDDETIRQVVRESQLFESLVLYKNPSAFDERDLDRYWTPELDVNANDDRRRIKEAVKKLNNEGRRYGDETKCEQLEFQSVEINKVGNFATVRTLEKWFIAEYGSDGQLLKNKFVGPYFVDYIVRKVDGQWLIQKSTTARTNRPIPSITGLDLVSEAYANKQFFLRIIGQDFEPETVFVEVVGPGCSANTPCKVPNSVLREYSKLSGTMLDNVPVTLSSGEFKITVRNGDSQPSNGVELLVR